METVHTQQGDTVDRLTWRHYGDTAMTESILEANPGLAAYGPILPHGIRVRLPPRQTVSTPTVTLWP